MSRPNLMAGVSRFAHLTGLARQRGADDKPADDENQIGAADDHVQGEGDDDVEGEGKKGKKAKKADGTDPDQGDDAVPADSDAETDDEDQGDDAVPPEGGKKKGQGDDDDDDESEMRGASVAAKARLRERDRIAAIFAVPAAAANFDLALSLAFETRLPRSEAVAVLKKGGKANAGGARGDRSSRNPNGLGPDRAPSGGGAQGARPKTAVQSSWDAALKKAGVKTKG